MSVSKRAQWRANVVSLVWWTNFESGCKKKWLTEEIVTLCIPSSVSYSVGRAIEAVAVDPAVILREASLPGRCFKMHVNFRKQANT